MNGRARLLVGCALVAGAVLGTGGAASAFQPPVIDPPPVEAPPVAPPVPEPLPAPGGVPGMPPIIIGAPGEQQPAPGSTYDAAAATRCQEAGGVYRDTGWYDGGGTRHSYWECVQSGAYQQPGVPYLQASGTTWPDFVDSLGGSVTDLQADHWDATHTDSYVMQPVFFSSLASSCGTPIEFGQTSDGSGYGIKFECDHPERYLTYVRDWHGATHWVTSNAAWPFGQWKLVTMVRVSQPGWSAVQLSVTCTSEGSLHDASETTPYNPPWTYQPASGFSGPLVRYAAAQFGSIWRGGGITCGAVEALESALNAETSVQAIAPPPTVPPAPTVTAPEVPTTPTTVEAPGPTLSTIPEGTTASSTTDDVLAQRVAGLFGHLEAHLSGLVDYLLNGLLDGLHWLGDVVVAAVSALADVLVSVGQAIVNAVTSLATVVWYGLQSLLTGITTALHWLGAWFAFCCRWLVTALTSALGSLLATLFVPTVSLDTLVEESTTGTAVEATLTSPVMATDPFKGSVVAEEVDPPVSAAAPSGSFGGACPSVDVPAPVSRTIYVVSPPESGCPGVWGGARSSFDDQAGSLWGHRGTLRAFSALILWAVFLIKIARAMPWNKEDELSAGWMLLGAVEGRT